MPDAYRWPVHTVADNLRRAGLSVRALVDLLAELCIEKAGRILILSQHEYGNKKIQQLPAFPRIDRKKMLYYEYVRNGSRIEKKLRNKINR